MRDTMEHRWGADDEKFFILKNSIKVFFNPWCGLKWIWVDMGPGQIVRLIHKSNGWWEPPARWRLCVASRWHMTAASGSGRRIRPSPLRPRRARQIATMDAASPASPSAPSPPLPSPTSRASAVSPMTTISRHYFGGDSSDDDHDFYIDIIEVTNHYNVGAFGTLTSFEFIDGNRSIKSWYMLWSSRCFCFS